VDFRGPDILDFVYHCHIAEHEDERMMAIFRVRADLSSLSLTSLIAPIGLTGARKGKFR